jgi:hypothetical protein
MPQTRTCPLGHRWEGDGPAGAACPVCASAGAPWGDSEAATVVGAGDELPPAPVTTPWRPDTPLAAAGPESPRRLPAIPGYEIVGELGRGGMGVVYQARHLGLKRPVALKVIRAGDYAGAHELARFRAEAEAVARLQHPNIVQVYEVGAHDGLPFFALEFCAGGSLARRLDGRPLPPTQAAEIVEVLARAMAAAHRGAVIHRDLKPANVLLTADNTPKVTDFGLAKRLDETRLTASGAVMGTPSYMAPEQARGDVTAVGPAADVYALGAILYECLTGRPPFTAESTHDVITQVIGREPVPPSRVGPKLPRDLDVICLKCLEKEPAQRYASADALADDLGRFRAAEPIQARPVGHVERVWRRVKRNPVLAGLSLAVGGLLLVVAILMLHGAHPGDPAPTAAAPGPGDDEVLQVVAELNRTDPGWRLEQLEAKRPVVPPERNSATRIAAAKRLLPAGWSKQFQQLRPTLGARPAGAALTPSQLAAVRALRQGAAAALAEARPLADVPEGRHPVNYSRVGLMTLLPHAEDTRLVAELLGLDALSQALDGRLGEALTACRAAVNAGRSLGDEPSVVTQLARMACVSLGTRDAEWVLGHGAPPEPEAAELQRLLEREAAEPVLLITARGERGLMHWVMSAATTGDLEPGPVPVTAVLGNEPGLAEELKAMPSGLAARQAHAWLLRHLTRFAEIARRPDHQQVEAVREWDRIKHTAPDGARLLLVDGPKLVEICLRHRAGVRCAAVALAVERFRLKHGRWPDALADLGPELLKEVPVDPYDGKPLRYRRLPEGVTVYAVGPDGRDDGGKLDAANAGRAGSDVGFRLWDVERRRPSGPRNESSADK